MNEIELLCEACRAEFPEAVVSLDRPLLEGGIWALDVKLDDYYLSVAWREGKGFGIVANPEHGYGERADEVYLTREEAELRILELIVLRELTTGPEVFN